VSWALQDAKNRFSEVARKAHAEGPQTVTLRGEPYVTVTAFDPAQKAAAKPSLRGLLLAGPEWDDEMVAAVNNRSKDGPREIEF
jgi:prevent-host-death family protein